MFVGAAVILVVLLQLIPDSVRSNESTDYTGFYKRVAEQVLNGQGLHLPGGRFADRFPPGFPLLLAAVFGLGQLVGLSHVTSASVLVVGAMATSCVLLFSIADELFPRPVAWLAALAWITYPLNLIMASQPYSEVPFTTLLYAAVLLLVRSVHRRRFRLGAMAGTGLALGVCALIRPAAIVVWLPIAVVLVIVSSSWTTVGRRLAAVGTMVACAIAVLVPWVVYASAVTGKFVPLSTGGTDAITAGLTLNHRADQEGKVTLPADVDRLMADIARQESELDDSNRAIVRRLGEERPSTLLELGLIKAARSWYATDSLNGEALVLAVQALYLVFAAIGLVLVWRSLPLIRPALWLVGAIVAYFWAVTVIVASIVRYMSPVAGLLLPLVAFVVVRGWNRVRHLGA